MNVGNMMPDLQVRSQQSLTLSTLPLPSVKERLSSSGECIHIRSVFAYNHRFYSLIFAQYSQVLYYVVHY
jgi:hypothetical protein